MTTTTNAGATWTRVDNNGADLPNRFVTDIAIDPFNSNRVFITLGGYRTGSVWYTDDAGVSWHVRNGAPPYHFPVIQVNTTRRHPADPFWVPISTNLDAIYIDAGARPYQTLTQAEAAAGDGSRIHVFNGTFPTSPVTIEKRVEVSTSGGAVVVQ